MSDYPPHHLIWMVTASGASMPVLEPIVTPPRLAGKLTLTVKKAKRLYDAARIGKMDPYCELKIGEEKKRTQVHKKGDVDPTWEEKIEFQLSGDETSLRVRVHNKTLLSNSLIGTARLPLDYLIVLHSGIYPSHSTASSNLDGHTFWCEIGRETRQAVPAGAVLLSVDSFQWDREEDREAMRHAMTVKVDRRGSLPSILHPDLASRETSQNEGERERKERSQSLTGEPSPTASSHGGGFSATTSSSLGQPVANKTLPSPRPTAPSTHASTSSSSSSFSHNPLSSPHSRQSSLLPSSKLRLFGGPLSNGIARSKSSVPVVVYVCIQYLIYHGLATVGLFRISPSSVVVDAIKAAFENSDSVNISDPHATAAVLKTYFRELQEPLIPYAAFQRFVQAMEGGGDGAYGRLRECIDQLDEDHRTVLSFLIHFLTLVAAQSEVNKMSPRNLAVVWAPNLLRGPNSNPDQHAPDQQAMAREMHKAEECIAMLIEGFERVWPEGPPRPFQLEHPTLDRATVATPRQGATKLLGGKEFKEEKVKGEKGGQPSVVTPQQQKR